MRNNKFKPIVPEVQASVWKELYSAAEKFKSLEPWNILDDRDLICVRNHSNGDIGFGAVMGSGGTLFGFALYRGTEGLRLYQELIDKAGESLDDDDIYALQNCVKLEFTSRSDVRPEDHAVMKQLNLSFRGRNAWPEFRSYLPGYAPWFLTEPEARLLALGIKAACVHHERVQKGEVKESIRDGECLMYEPLDGSASEFRSGWEPLPVYERKSLKPPVLNLAVIDEMKRKKLALGMAWEADAFYLPSTILDSDRPYFTRIALVCEQASGFMLEPTIGAPGDATYQLLTDAICSAAKQMGVRPETIFVRNAEIAAAITPLANVLGIVVRKKKNLGAIGKFKMEMRDFMTGGGRRGR